MALIIKVCKVKQHVSNPVMAGMPDDAPSGMTEIEKSSTDIIMEPDITKVSKTIANDAKMTEKELNVNYIGNSQQITYLRYYVVNVVSSSEIIIV